MQDCGGGVACSGPFIETHWPIAQTSLSQHPMGTQGMGELTGAVAPCSLRKWQGVDKERSPSTPSLLHVKDGKTVRARDYIVPNDDGCTTSMRLPWTGG
jgi:hypothetical protein